jgi:hypothetical protein
MARHVFDCNENVKIQYKADLTSYIVLSLSIPLSGMSRNSNKLSRRRQTISQLYHPHFYSSYAVFSVHFSHKL